MRGRTELTEGERIAKEWLEGKRNLPEYLQGNTGLLGRQVGGVVDTVLDYMVPDALGVGEFFGNLAQQAAETELGQTVIGAINDFSEAYPRRARNIGEALDTLGLFGGVGTLFKATKALPQNKGQFSSEGEVIVPGFYKPDDVKFNDKIENFIEDKKQQAKQAVTEDTTVPLTARMVSSEVGQKAIEGARFAKGFGQWAGRGVSRGVKSVLSPSSRALYAEYGINQVDLQQINKWKAAQAKVQKLEESGADSEALKEAKEAETEARQVAQSQLQQTANIRQQANTASPTKIDELDAIMRDVVDPAVLDKVGTPYFQPSKSDQWYNSLVAPSRPNPRKQDYSAIDSDVIQRHLYNQHKPSKDAKFIVKRASTYETGKHWEDLFSRNTKLDPVAKAFIQLKKDTGRFKFENNAEMMDYLKKQQYGKGGDKRYTIKFDGPQSAENSNGIWITLGKVGSAKVEGGINALYRVDLDGGLLGVMSDKHDFLENIVGIKQMVNDRLPTDVIAITKPLRYDIFSSRETLFKGFDKVPNIKRDTGKKNAKAAKGPSYRARTKENLNRVSELTPSPEEVARQRNSLIQRGASVPAGLGLMSLAAEETQ